MDSLYALSIRLKIILLCMATTGAALVLACGAFILCEVRLYRSSMEESLSTLAEIVAQNSQAGVIYNDTKAVGDTLSALKAERGIVYACVLDSTGKAFAEYRRPGPAQPDMHLLPPCTQALRYKADRV